MPFQSKIKCANCGSSNVDIQMKGSENDGVFCRDCGYNSANEVKLTTIDMLY